MPRERVGRLWILHAQSVPRHGLWERRDLEPYAKWPNPCLPRRALELLSNSVHIQHEQSAGHSFLEMPNHGRLGPWNRNREHVAIGGPEFYDVGAIVFRAIDHDPVLPVVVIARAL